MGKKEEEKIIKKNTALTMCSNAFLAAIKLFAGIYGNSSVLISDAINSLSDIATNIVVYFSAKLSKKESDKEHPYGHEKIDSLISMFLGIALLLTAFEVGKNAIITLVNYFQIGPDVGKPKIIALVVALITIGLKEFLFRKTKKDAKKAKSQALLAQAWDHRSDTIASAGAVIGILGAMFGHGYLDPIASILISLFILRLGIKIIKTGIDQVVDKAASEETQQQIIKLVHSHPEIKKLDELKTRLTGMRLYVDLEISMISTLSLEESHKIAEELHDQIENEIPDVIHCMIHINPFYEK